ncbi:putative baseplate assembly protein [Streptomyces nogalater]
MNRPCSCGACGGHDERLAPALHNPPGRTALDYRVGEYGTFLAALLDRLASPAYPALAGLTVRTPDDPAVGLLDAAAVLGDLLTFHSERIADEAYLRTARDHRSLVLLVARRTPAAPRTGRHHPAGVHPRTRPACRDPAGADPRGARSHSVPASADEQALTFETSRDLTARWDWNELTVRRRLPSLITPDDLTRRSELFVEGTATSLRTGDRLLFVFGEQAGGERKLIPVAGVRVDREEEITALTLPQSAPPTLKELVAEVRRWTAAPAVPGEPGDEPPTPEVPNPRPVSRLIEDFDDQHLAPCAPIWTPSTPRRSSPPASAIRWPACARPRSWRSRTRTSRRGSNNWRRSSPNWPGGRCRRRPAQPADAGTPAARGDNPPGRAPPPRPGRATPPTRPAPTPAKPPSAPWTRSSPPCAPPPRAPAGDPDPPPRHRHRPSADRPRPGPGPLPGLAHRHHPGRPPTAARPPRDACHRLPVRRERPLKPVQDARGRVIRTADWPLTGAALVSTRVVYDPAGKTPVRAEFQYVEGGGSDQRAENLPVTGPVTFALGPGRVDLSTRAVRDDAPSKPTRRPAADAEPGVTARFHAGLPEGSLFVSRPGDDGTVHIALTNGTAERFSLKPGDSRRFPHGEYQVSAAYTVGSTAPNVEIVIASKPAPSTAASCAWTASRTASPPAAGWRSSARPRARASPATPRSPSSPPRWWRSGRRRTPTTASPAAAPNSPWPTLAGRVGRPALPHPRHHRARGGRAAAPGRRAARRGRTRQRDRTRRAVRRVAPRPDPHRVRRTQRRTRRERGHRRSGHHRRRRPGRRPRLPGDHVHTRLTLTTNLVHRYHRASVRILGNVVEATHGESREEAIGSGDSDRVNQTFALWQSPLTWLAADNPLGATPVLEIRVDGVLWHQADSLAGRGPTERVYITGTAADGRTTVTFGDGVHGARLPSGHENVRARYRFGTGKAADVPADRITQPLTRPLGVTAVTNPFPATGGSDADGPGLTRRTIPLAVLALDRLVSPADYEDFARPRGIGRATARELFDGRRRVLHVTVAAPTTCRSPTTTSGRCAPP